MSKEYIDKLTYKIIGCAIEIHKHLGPGLLESVYHQCFIRELYLRGLSYETQVFLPIEYKGLELSSELRVDVLVEDLIIVELKAIEGILPVHKAQVISYMKLMNKPKGLLINFNCTNIFKEGQFTFVNNIYTDLPI